LYLHIENKWFISTNNSIRTIGADLNDLSVLPAEDKTAEGAVLNLHWCKTFSIFLYWVLY
jgi:hypothetical protein